MAVVNLKMAAKLQALPSDTAGGMANAHGVNPSSHRRRTLHVLFVHRDADAINSCLQELENGQFTVRSDLVLNLPQCEGQLRSQSYDVIVVEYPSPSCKSSQSLQLFRQRVRETPLICLTSVTSRKAISELSAQAAFEYVELENIAQMSMAVRRVLNERALREELDEARKALQHSQSLYRALVDNPAYGIYRCDSEGKVLDVNQALVTMLGYESTQQLLLANQESQVIPNLHLGTSFTGRSAETKQIEPVEIEWKRKDGTSLKARLSGRGIYDDHGNFAGHEIIAVDVTGQRTLEDQLRHQASSDSLTGLANHRRLFEVLHAEICRSKRTSREFSLLLLDLDGLKTINDRFGHLTGDKALCRLAKIMSDCCRTIDTAARHGGDEFALVLPETGWAAATLVGNRICDLLRKDAEQPALSVSVGLATFPKDAGSIGTLLYAADKSLYEMKALQPRASRARRFA
ncbi:MAG TPA: diguanylate cyclase [Candidatus Acidoferrum sp.]|nr:diguanylate cyclase [Candidatus Acidoferrum sp.]